MPVSEQERAFLVRAAAALAEGGRRYSVANLVRGLIAAEAARSGMPGQTIDVVDNNSAR